MKVLVDVSAGQAVAETIRNLGHDAVSVRDVDPRMDDADILAWAVRESRLVVTMDKDFGELVFHSGEPHAGVLLLRMESLRSVDRIRIVTELFEHFTQELPGHFSVYQNGRLRIR